MFVKERCSHFTMLPVGMRVLFTGTLVVLGVGYLFAMIHIFASHAGHDGDPGLSVNDLVIAYSGSKEDTKLEAALKGPMAGMLPQEERDEIVAWVRRGALKEEYVAQPTSPDIASSQKIRPISAIIGQRCIACHNGANPHVPDFNNYDGVMATVALDTGMDIFTLVRVSHIHLFGITFIFFLTGSIFCHAYIKPVWLKCLILGIPFVAIVMDIGSWYLTKIYPPFAWVVMISGGLMGLAFAAQLTISIYQMWLYKLPSKILESGGYVSE
ncbi:MAG: elongation factor-1 alpha [Ectothiorhodospiraceae bacterium]|nr:elongation factor-1 alpha [Ectothiorhodospiraceae bacterium]